MRAPAVITLPSFAALVGSARSLAESDSSRMIELMCCRSSTWKRLVPSSASSSESPMTPVMRPAEINMVAHRDALVGDHVDLGGAHDRHPHGDRSTGGAEQGY